MGARIKTRSHINQEEMKKIARLVPKKLRTKRLLIFLAGMGLLEVLGFCKSISESIILLRIIPIVLAETAQHKIKTKFNKLNSSNDTT